jgi:hypothetical protein
MKKVREFAAESPDSLRRYAAAPKVFGCIVTDKVDWESSFILGFELCQQPHHECWSADLFARPVQSGEDAVHCVKIGKQMAMDTPGAESGRDLGKIAQCGIECASIIVLAKREVHARPLKYGNSLVEPFIGEFLCAGDALDGVA